MVVYAIASSTGLHNGTLIVEAQTSSTYYQSRSLSVSVSVAGTTETTPFNFSLPQGTYTVSFQTLQWYTTPASTSATVLGGGHSYAVGTYDPIPVFVSVNQDEFNATSVQVLHTVTPLIFVNLSAEYQTISSNLTGRIIIPPMQNYTYVFQKTGGFGFSFVSATSPNLLVTAV